MQYIPYNSRLEYHKYPFGAVRDSDNVTFRIILPREFRCTAARLLIKADGENYRSLGMYWDCMQGDGEEWWKVEFSPGKTGLY